MWRVELGPGAIGGGIGAHRDMVGRFVEGMSGRDTRGGAALAGRPGEGRGGMGRGGCEGVREISQGGKRIIEHVDGAG